MLLLEISKKSKYDVADIIMNKRIKGFLKSIQHNSEDDPAEGL